MTVLAIEDIKGIFASLKDMAAANKDYLIKLDGVMGDSDLGLTMNAVFSAADAHVRVSEEGDLGKLLAQTGMVMAKAAPSTMGTLIATGFMRGGKALRGTTEIGVSEYRDFWKDFVEGIMERGRSKPGEKTIVDALYPAYQAIEQCLQDGGDLCEAAGKAAEAAEQGLENTKTMVAQHGRAAYFGDKSRDAQDPGATVGSLLLKTFSDYVAQNK